MLRSLGVRVESVQGRLVDEGVLSGSSATGVELDILGRSDNGLNFVGVDDAGDVGVADLSGGEADNIRIVSKSRSNRYNLWVKTYK